jgi:chitin synthase
VSLPLDTAAYIHEDEYEMVAKPQEMEAPQRLNRKFSKYARREMSIRRQRRMLGKNPDADFFVVEDPIAHGGESGTDTLAGEGEGDERKAGTYVKKDRVKSVSSLADLKGQRALHKAMNADPDTTPRCYCCGVDIWLLYAYITTCWAFPFFMSKCCGMSDARIQRAWREKMALMSIVLLFSVGMIFGFFFLPKLLCPEGSSNLELSSLVGGSNRLEPKYRNGLVIIRGRAYNFTKALDLHQNSGLIAFDEALVNAMFNLQSADMSVFFPPFIEEKCKDVIVEGNPVPPCKMESLTSVEYCHTDQRYLRNLFVSNLAANWTEVRNNKDWFVFNGAVLGMSNYLSSGVRYFGDEAHELILSSLGTDASLRFYSQQQVRLGMCLTELYRIAIIDGKTTSCVLYEIMEMVSMIAIFAVMLAKFCLAFIFQWFMAAKLGKLAEERNLQSSRRRQSGRIGISRKNKALTNSTMSHFTQHQNTSSGSQGTTLSQSSQGTLVETRSQSPQIDDWELRDIYVILLVTCYSEDESGLRLTLDSLASTTYNNQHKLLFIVADGLITGSGNSKSTPDIVLSMLELLPSESGEPSHSYIAIGEGSKRYNRARVYAGFYVKDGSRVPAVVVVKCGGEQESNDAKPGNRGKRDSQMILMSFFHKVLFDSYMTPLDYALFKQIARVTSGVTADRYEIVLMVDADTKVAPDSLGRMIACMAWDDRVIGLCGETRIANKRATWVTAIQVFEYYISHHLAKAFESVFGGVTCLPGCFCMYRIKAPKDRGQFWAPILCDPNIIAQYSQSKVETLHQKNLLLLGEDRFLSTLMLRTFPTRKIVFVPQAVCHTFVPDQFKVLLSQRRRWINSTVHNLMELVLVRELCGIFCFSMQFVVFMELVGTILLPIAIIFTL